VSPASRPEAGKPVLVTGSGGFVGRHLMALLGASADVLDADVTDPENVARAVRDAKPAAIVHLAARSSVAESWSDPAETWRVNTIGTVNLLEVVRHEAPGARVLVVSSCEVYGKAAEIPTPEDASPAPLSPYAASKAGAEVAADQAQRSNGLEAVVARPFPHVGPGQDERFAIGSWVRQIARLERTGGGLLRVGDLSVQRDLTDVRDVCRAYALLLDPAVPAETYNIASGTAVPLERVGEILVRLAKVPVTVEQENERLRAVDIPVLHGDPARIEAATGWRAEIALEQSLADALAAARADEKRKSAA
jgi:GDP-4-dehydro-6-deoxy-D-mannose reductase